MVKAYKETIKLKALELRAQGLAFEEIQKKLTTLKVTPVPCLRTLKAWASAPLSSQKVLKHDRSKVGRPSKLSNPWEQRLLRALRAQRTWVPPSEFWREFKRTHNPPFGYHTVWRWMKKSKEVQVRRPAKKFSLTKAQRKVRVDWCKKHMDEPWETAVYADEKSWQRGSRTTAKLLGLATWEYPKVLFVPTRFSLRLWGCIGYAKNSSLRLIEGTMKTKQYFTILKSMLRVNQKLSVFVHDNAPPHGRKRYRRELDTLLKKKKLRALFLPPYSPDLNPIENFWSIMAKRVFQGGNKTYQSPRLLEAAVWRVFDELTAEGLPGKLAASMPARIAAVLAAKGAMTKS